MNDVGQSTMNMAAMKTIRTSREAGWWRRVGLTAEKLDEILEQRVRIDKYLDFRFRNFVVITQNEVADYYKDAYVPRFKARAPGKIVPTLEEARAEIEKTLTEAKIETDTDSFLDNARDRAEIVILNPV